MQQHGSPFCFGEGGDKYIYFYLIYLAHQQLSTLIHIMKKQAMDLWTSVPIHYRQAQHASQISLWGVNKLKFNINTTQNIIKFQIKTLLQQITSL